MSRVLILFGTTDGQTAKIARFLADELGLCGVTPEIADAGAGPANPDPFDAVIVAGSIHAGGYQSCVTRWVRLHAATLRRKPTAFLSVCLAVLQHDAKVDEDLAAIKRRFIARTGWDPGQFKFVAGALPYTRYGWLKRMIMRRMSGRAGGATDVSRDYEYTDWEDLRSFAGTFAASIGARVPVASLAAHDA